MIYHHSHYKKNADGVEGILYTQSAVQENQYYAGQVYVKEQYASTVKDLLKKVNSVLDVQGVLNMENAF